MFNIQYEAPNGEHCMQSFDSKNRLQLANHLSRFDRPILAVYEQASPITKAIRAELAKRPQNNMSRAALDFISSRP